MKRNSSVPTAAMSGFLGNRSQSGVHSVTVGFLSGEKGESGEDSGFEFISSYPPSSPGLALLLAGRQAGYRHPFLAGPVLGVYRAGALFVKVRTKLIAEVVP